MTNYPNDILSSLKEQNPIYEYRLSLSGALQRKSKDRWRGICLHNKETGTCIECDSEKLCFHKKIKKFCKHCTNCPSKVACEHGIILSECKICNPMRFCVHNRVKKLCKHCDGSSLCQHKRILSVCKECKGCLLYTSLFK